MELKNRLINGIVNPAPTDINIKGDIAFKIRFQSYELFIEKNPILISALGLLSSFILQAAKKAQLPKIVISHRMERSVITMDKFPI